MKTRTKIYVSLLVTLLVDTIILIGTWYFYEKYFLWMAIAIGILALYTIVTNLNALIVLNREIKLGQQSIKEYLE